MSLNILYILSDLLNISFNCWRLNSRPSFIINAPGVEGSLTKSQHISSKSLYNDQLTFEKVLRSDSKVVISIDGSELVKGRGGPRCMTLPIKRGSL